MRVVRPLVIGFSKWVTLWAARSATPSSWILKSRLRGWKNIYTIHYRFRPYHLLSMLARTLRVIHHFARLQLCVDHLHSSACKAFQHN